MNAEGLIDWPEVASSSIDDLLEAIPESRWADQNPSDGYTLLHVAIEQEDEDAVRALIPHFDLSRSRTHGRHGGTITPLQTAWESTTEIFELLVCGGSNLKKAMFLFDAPESVFDAFAKFRIFLFHGGRLECASTEWRGFGADPILAMDRGLRRCRSVVAALLFLKRNRRHPAIASMDRFLVREIALEVWRTRVQDEWIHLTPTVVESRLYDLARAKKLYPHARKHMTCIQWETYDLARISIECGDMQMLRFLVGFHIDHRRKGIETEHCRLALCAIVARNAEALRILLTHMRIFARSKWVEGIFEPIVTRCIDELPETQACLEALVLNVPGLFDVKSLPADMAELSRTITQHAIVQAIICRKPHNFDDDWKLSKRIGREIWASRYE